MDFYRCFKYNSDVVPVVMFHSVGLSDSDWIYKHLSENLAKFEEKIATLKKFGYHFIFWSDLYEYMSGRKKIKHPSVMLSFDDGYLDNWVYAFPILKKYGARATIFVNPDFCDPSIERRPTLDDVWEGKIALKDLTVQGFLNWDEIRVMHRSGLIDIQSHALTHTWYPSGPKVIGFHSPGEKKYPWMAWNRYIKKKPFYMGEDQSNLIPLGTPIYEHKKALVCRRFFPPSDIETKLAEFVRLNDPAKFFKNFDWELKLRIEYNRLWATMGHSAEYESEFEYQNRVLYELKQSKLIIEQQLNKPVDYICWPGGGYNKKVLSLAKEAGFKSWTLASKDKSNFRNRSGCDPIQIKRISSFTYYGSSKEKNFGLTSGFYFLSVLERHRGSKFYKWIGRGLLLKAMVSKFLKYRSVK